MNTLPVLTLMGSIMFLGYLVYDGINPGDRITKRHRYWLVVVGLSYLVSLRPLKAYLQLICNRLAQWGFSIGIDYYNETGGFFKREIGELTQRSELYQLDLKVYAIWTTGAIIILLLRLSYFLWKIRRLRHHCEPENNEKMLKRLEELKSEMGIRCKVRLLYHGGEEAFSTGWWDMDIFLPHKWKGDVPEIVLRHELAHIRNKDTYLKAFANLVFIVHWINPLGFVYMCRVSRMCEWQSDAAAVSKCSEAEKKAYAYELLRMATEPERGMSDNLLTSGFARAGRKNKLIQERIGVIVTKKSSIWKRMLSGVVLTVSLFASSLTVFAYDDVKVFKTEDETVGEIWSQDEETDEAESWFALSGKEMTLAINDVSVIYDEQFIAIDGTIYAVNGEAVPYIWCNHSYQNGTYTRHVKHADGSCDVQIFDAKRCKWCEEVVVNALLQINSFVTCPH